MATDTTSGTLIGENPDYLTSQLITYLGNKRALLKPIAEAITRVQKRLGKEKLQCFDVFSGSGVVSRLMKAYASRIISNDLEDYAAIIGQCYLANKSEVDLRAVADIVAELNRTVMVADLPTGFIEELYAPADENNIKPDDRVFYTRENARRLDNYRRLIEKYDKKFRPLLLGPLLSKASIHANTGGIFRAFYRNRHTGVGQFGGTGSDALKRILSTITLEPPILSNFECDYQILQLDANQAVRQVDEVDLVYLDPPYNHVTYGANYFMLNLVAKYQRPTDITPKSGVPKDWRRSGYNSKPKAYKLMADLLSGIKAPYIMASYNNEGFINVGQMTELLSSIGKVDIVETKYNAYRAGRNLHQRSLHTTEYLFIVERK